MLRLLARLLPARQRHDFEASVDEVYGNGLDRAALRSSGKAGPHSAAAEGMRRQLATARRAPRGAAGNRGGENDFPVASAGGLGVGGGSLERDSNVLFKPIFFGGARSPEEAAAPRVAIMTATSSTGSPGARLLGTAFAHGPGALSSSRSDASADRRGS